MENITIDNRDYQVKVGNDYCMGAPWEEHDGHGVVSEWTSRTRRAGEWILAADRNLRRYYDYAGTMKKAKAEGWGLPPEEAKGLTANQIIEKAVQKDFRRLAAWCNDEWGFVYVVVSGPDKEAESLSGIESDNESYIVKTVQELAENLHTVWKKLITANGIDF